MADLQAENQASAVHRLRETSADRERTARLVLQRVHSCCAELRRYRAILSSIWLHQRMVGVAIWRRERDSNRPSN